MLKYANTQVVFTELPNEVTLCINISGCPIHCPDCHSKYLWEDKGVELTYTELRRLIEANNGITAVCIMGGDNNYHDVERVAENIHKINDRMTTSNMCWLRVGWYSGRDELPTDLNVRLFDYIKVGHYDKEKGGLDKETTNQRLYKVVLLSKFRRPSYRLDDITYKLQ